MHHSNYNTYYHYYLSKFILYSLNMSKSGLDFSSDSMHNVDFIKGDKKIEKIYRMFDDDQLRILKEYLF